MGRTAADKITVGCKLPNGIILQHPMDPAIKAVLNGKNRETIIGSGYGLTDVDADLWEAWIDKYKTFQPFTSGAIFAAKTIDSVRSIAKEYKERKTGLEPMPQEVPGLKPADKD